MTNIPQQSLSNERLNVPVSQGQMTLAPKEAQGLNTQQVGAILQAYGLFNNSNSKQNKDEDQANVYFLGHEKEKPKVSQKEIQQLVNLRNQQLFQQQKQMLQQQQINQLQKKIDLMRVTRQAATNVPNVPPGASNTLSQSIEEVHSANQQIISSLVSMNRPAQLQRHSVPASFEQRSSIENPQRKQSANQASTKKKIVVKNNTGTILTTPAKEGKDKKIITDKKKKAQYDNESKKNKTQSNFNTSIVERAKEFESGVLNSRQSNVAALNTNSQTTGKKNKQRNKTKEPKQDKSPAPQSEKKPDNKQLPQKKSMQIPNSAAAQTVAPPPAAKLEVPQLTAKEKRRIRLEQERERERERLEQTFKASSLYISRQAPRSRSFVNKPNAIIVYTDTRLVKLDINRTPIFQPSAVPETGAASKPLLITPEELQEFYLTKVRFQSHVGRAMEVVEEPKALFDKDQYTIDRKQHTIQERKIREVLDQQIYEKNQSMQMEELMKNPIIFPSQNIKDSTIFFNSRFESGNLREVEKLHEYEYNLYVNFDFNSSTHSQWYFFSVRNIAKGKQYKFNIMNLQKDESCYQIGMKPFVYSVQRNKQYGTNQWRRGCENVCYYKNKLKTKVRECAPDHEYDEDNIPCYEYEDESFMYVSLNTLSFCYEFDYENDITFFAYFQPYTLCDLEDYLYQIPKRFDEDHLKSIYKREKLCDTIGGRPCYVLTITDNVQEDDIDVDQILENSTNKNQSNFGSYFSTEVASSRIDEDGGEKEAMLSGYQRAAKEGREMDPNHHQKQTIFLSSRVHPGESNASFMIQGAIDFLLNQNDKQAKMLRETFIFKIIPMLNPDGVESGHYRCNYIGADLNRRWPNPSKLLHPTIYYTKKLLKMCHGDNQVLLFCDFHGHTRKRNVFMYGCVSPQNEINQHKNNNLIRMIPFYLGQKNKLFSFADCKFANEREKESTGRLVMFKEFGILNSYTIEATFYSYYNPKQKRMKVNVQDDEQIKVEELIEIGNDFCEVLTTIINSKILKRKFILDTANPLGSMVPGQGGNPLTQFLMSQQKEKDGNLNSMVKNFMSANNGLFNSTQQYNLSADNSTKKKPRRQQTDQQISSTPGVKISRQIPVGPKNYVQTMNSGTPVPVAQPKKVNLVKNSSIKQTIDQKSIPMESQQQQHISSDVLNAYINQMVLNQPMTQQELVKAQSDLEEVRSMIAQQKRQNQSSFSPKSQNEQKLQIDIFKNQINRISDLQSIRNPVQVDSPKINAMQLTPTQRPSEKLRRPSDISIVKRSGVDSIRDSHRRGILLQNVGADQIHNSNDFASKRSPSLLTESVTGNSKNNNDLQLGLSGLDKQNFIFGNEIEQQKFKQEFLSHDDSKRQRLDIGVMSQKHETKTFNLNELTNQEATPIFNRIESFEEAVVTQSREYIPILVSTASEQPPYRQRKRSQQATEVISDFAIQNLNEDGQSEQHLSISSDKKGIKFNYTEPQSQMMHIKLQPNNQKVYKELDISSEEDPESINVNKNNQIIENRVRLVGPSGLSQNTGLRALDIEDDVKTPMISIQDNKRKLVGRRASSIDDSKEIQLQYQKPNMYQNSPVKIYSRVKNFDINDSRHEANQNRISIFNGVRGIAIGRQSNIPVDSQQDIREKSKSSLSSMMRKTQTGGVSNSTSKRNADVRTSQINSVRPPTQQKGESQHVYSALLDLVQQDQQKGATQSAQKKNIRLQEKQSIEFNQVYKFQ